MSTVEETAPSATFIMLVPFCVLLFAWSRPRIWTRMRSEIAYPEASSAAELIFMPDETFFRLLARAEEFLFSVFSVEMADMLFLTTMDMMYSSLMK